MTEDSKIRKNFLDLDDDESSFENSRVVILPVPYEKTVTFGKGTSKGPGSIIYASTSVELYDDELGCEPFEIGIHTLPELNCEAAPEDMVGLVQAECKRLLDHDKFIIMLGGEHSVTLGAVRAHRQAGREFSVLNIDAHCDLRNSYEGTPYNHACVMRRALDEGCTLTECGIRSYSIEEAEYIKTRDDINIFHARDIVESANKNWIDEAVSSLLPDVYISFDVDSLDPSVMPSTGTPEPGGLTWYHATALFRKTFQEKNVIGMDIVELAPIKGLLGPDVLAAKLAYKAVGYKMGC